MTVLATYKKIVSLIASVLLSSATVGFYGCSEETDLPGQMYDEAGPAVPVLFTLSNLQRSVSGADGIPADPATDAEKINSWWIAFVDSSGTVRHIVSGEPEEAVEAETFRAIVPPGQYTLYAFANITPAELTTASGVEFAEGKKVILPEGIENVDDAVWSVSLNGLDASRPLPMSGILKDIRVRGVAEESFTIEVVRMVAKIELVISNPSSEDITINKVSLDPVTHSGISLFPRGENGIGYAHLGCSPYSPLPLPEYSRFTLTLPSGKVIKTGDEDTSLVFYVQESISQRANDNAFTVGLNVSHADGEAVFEQHAITRDILGYINRNDHIILPVTLSRYAVVVDAVFYPPIGGYPAAITDEDPDGAQIFTFLSGGEFSLVAGVTDKLTGRHCIPDYYSVTLTGITYPDGFYADSGIPSLKAGSTALPDEIIGILNPESTGRSVLTVRVDIYDRPRNEAEAVVTDSYTRVIYIIRENPE